MTSWCTQQHHSCHSFNGRFGPALWSANTNPIARGKNTTVYQVCKYVGKLMVVSIISVMRNLNISINSMLHYRISYIIKTNANNSFQLVVDIDYLNLTVQPWTGETQFSLLCLVLVHNVYCCWYTYVNDGIFRLCYLAYEIWGDFRGESSQIPNNLNLHN